MLDNGRYTPRRPLEVMYDRVRPRTTTYDCVRPRTTTHDCVQYTPPALETFFFRFKKYQFGPSLWTATHPLHTRCHSCWPSKYIKSITFPYFQYFLSFLLLTFTINFRETYIQRNAMIPMAPPSVSPLPLYFMLSMRFQTFFTVRSFFPSSTLSTASANSFHTADCS